MRPMTGGNPRCGRCHCELEGDELGCPSCGFNPRQIGLRISMGFLLIVVCSMTAIVLSIPIGTGLAPALTGLAAVAFGLSIATFAISFLATPSRLGLVFARF